MARGKFEITNFHTKHIGINDWIYINFKHIWKNMWNDNKPLDMSKRLQSVTPLPTFARNQNMGKRIEKKNRQNRWMGGLAMGEHKYRQKKS